MAFYGCYFSFDGLPCTEFGLMVYDLAGSKQSDTLITTAGEVIEDRVQRRYRSFFYGPKNKEKLEFNFSFGANHTAIDNHHHLDRWDIELIASWLTGHKELKWLEIEQPDMEIIRYKCIITELKLINTEREPWAFICKVSCDSPFAYLYPEEYSYSINGTQVIELYNKGSCNNYKPDIEITLSGSNTVTITNESDRNRTFQLNALPVSTGLTIHIDNENQIIRGSNDINLYPYFNMVFFRLARGNNRIKISGRCNVNFKCAFPINFGG